MQISFIKSGKKKEEKKKKRKEYVPFLIIHSFIAVIPSYCELRLGTEKILLLEVLVSSTFVLFLLLSAVHVVCSSSFPPARPPSPVSTLSPQDVLNSGLGRLFLYSPLVILAF